MNKKSVKLYESLTQLDEKYLLEAEEFRPEKHRGRSIRPQAWAGLAAAVVLAVGIGTALPEMNMKSDAAVSGSQVQMESQGSHSLNGSPLADEVRGEEYGVSTQEKETEIRLSDAVYVVLEEVTFRQGDEPEVVTYLERRDRDYHPVDTPTPTQSALCAGGGGELFLREGSRYYALTEKR